jgi:hypothetical protein
VRLVAMVSRILSPDPNSIHLTNLHNGHEICHLEILLGKNCQATAPGDPRSQTSSEPETKPTAHSLSVDLTDDSTTAET